jgi:TM2 domain-containing membrane protein YozV
MMSTEEKPMIQANQKYCSSCGEVILKEAELCVKCGVRQTTATTGEHNKYVASALAFFFGWFGVHKFYLGQIGLGVVYLLFCWTFIPAIIAFIEAIIYLAMSDESFNQKFNK